MLRINVSFGSTYSREVSVIYGVPKGSVFALFCMYFIQPMLTVFLFLTILNVHTVYINDSQCSTLASHNNVLQIILEFVETSELLRSSIQSIQLNLSSARLVLGANH